MRLGGCAATVEPGTLPCKDPEQEHIYVFVMPSWDPFDKLRVKEKVFLWKTMANHEFNPQSEVDHFGFLVEEQTTLLRAHTSLVEDELSGVAKRNALVIFNTTFGSNIRSLIKEHSRSEEVFGSEFTLINGKLTAEGYGTPETMLARTKAVRPELYNQEEAQAILKGVKLIESGKADAFAYSMHHDSGTRYVAFFEKVGTDTWKPRSVDIGKHIGRDLTQMEGADVIRLLHEKHGNTTRIEEGKFPLLVICEPKEVSAKEVVETGLMRSFITSADPSKMARSLYDRKREMKNTDGTDVHQRIPQEAHIAEIINKRTKTTKETLLTQPDSIRVADRAYDDITEIGTRVVRDAAPSIKNAGIAIVGEIRKKIQPMKASLEANGTSAAALFAPRKRQREERNPVRFNESIKKRHQEMQQGIVALTVIAEMRVAIHAVPMIFDSLAKKLPPSVEVMQKSIDRHAKKELRRKNRELRKTKREAIKDSTKVHDLKLARVEPLKKGKERKKRKKRRKMYVEIPTGSRKSIFGERGGRKDRGRRKRGSENGVKKIAAAEKLTPIDLEKQERRKKRKVRKELREWIGRWKHLERQRRVMKTVLVALAVTATEFVRGGKRAVHKEIRANLSRRRDKKQERLMLADKRDRVAFTGVQFALLLYQLLYTQRNFSETLQNEKDSREQTRGIAELLSHKGAHWMLLSIIWYLSMIREAGRTVHSAQFTLRKNSGQAVRRKKKKPILISKSTQLQTWQLPNQAIIFAYGS